MSKINEIKKYSPSLLEHGYGENIIIASNPVLSSLLTRLSSPETTHPLLNQLMKSSYEILLEMALNLFVGQEVKETPTRMQTLHSEAVLKEPVLSEEKKIITVNLARAGTYPSQVCFDYLNILFSPQTVRQDHFYVNRKTNEKNEVVGVDCTGSKIGGEVKDSIVLVPDPMGATGGTLCHVLDYYKNVGSVKEFIALHLIITPEYIARLKKEHPELKVVAGRIDRGLSSQKVLETVPGTSTEAEIGLNKNSYIVPGAGGIGELMNNADY